MKRFIIALTILVIGFTLFAQPASNPPAPKDEVLTAASAPGNTIRVVYKEKGKVKDGGQYIKKELFDQVVAANQKMGQYIEQISLAGIQVIDPGLYSVLTDSNFVYIHKSQLRPASTQFPPTPTPEAPKLEPKK